MTVELAGTRMVRKPWGSTDLRPWSKMGEGGAPVGELWFERTDRAAPSPALLLKLLFTREPLSIQVHPDDAFARSIGLEHGKTEAWYIVGATPDAQVGVGLKRQLTPEQLRGAIEDGSIADLLQWHLASEGAAVFIPAGTIHAIGAGLVIAEVQQRSDVTFRLFDHGRGRELHVDDAVAAAHANPTASQVAPRHLDDARTLLVACPHFILERIDLSPDSTWVLRADHETWVLLLQGGARVGQIDLGVGETVFLEADSTGIQVASGGLKALVAYVGGEPDLNLLRNIGIQNADTPLHSLEALP